MHGLNLRRRLDELLVLQQLLHRHELFAFLRGGLGGCNFYPALVRPRSCRGRLFRAPLLLLKHMQEGRDEVVNVHLVLVHGNVRVVFWLRGLRQWVAFHVIDTIRRARPVSARDGVLLTVALLDPLPRAVAACYALDLDSRRLLFGLCLCEALRPHALKKSRLLSGVPRHEKLQHLEHFVAELLIYRRLLLVPPRRGPGGHSLRFGYSELLHQLQPPLLALVHGVLDGAALEQPLQQGGSCVGAGLLLQLRDGRGLRSLLLPDKGLLLHLLRGHEDRLRPARPMPPLPLVLFLRGRQKVVDVLLVGGDSVPCPVSRDNRRYHQNRRRRLGVARGFPRHRFFQLDELLQVPRLKGGGVDLLTSGFLLRELPKLGAGSVNVGAVGSVLSDHALLLHLPLSPLASRAQSPQHLDALLLQLRQCLLLVVQQPGLQGFQPLVRRRIDARLPLLPFDRQSPQLLLLQLDNLLLPVLPLPPFPFLQHFLPQAHLAQVGQGRQARLEGPLLPHLLDLLDFC